MKYLLYPALLAVACFVSNSISVDIPSPVGRWMFDAASGGKDVSGRGNNAVSSGIDTFPNGPYPGVQGLWRLTGSTSSFAVIPNTNQALYTPRGWTFTTWFYNQGGVGPLFEFTTASQPGCSNYGLHIWMYPESTQFFLNPASGQLYGWSPTGSVPLNAWTQLAMTYTFETGVYSTYINGVEITSVRRTGTPKTIHATTNLPSVTIGRRCDSFGALKGAVYCMQWFNETLSGDQLKSAFLTCNPYSYQTPLGKWMFDSVTGGSDLTGNGNDGVPSGLGTFPKGPFPPVQGLWRLLGSSNSYVTIPNNQALTATQSWTFATWFFNEGGVGPLFEFTSGQPGCSNWGLHIWIISPGTQLLLNPASGQPYWSMPADAVPLNTWTQLALTYSFDSGVYRVFVNGVELVSSPFFGTAKFNHVTTSLPSVTIGRRCDSSGALKGALYCTQWFGTALNAPQLASAFSTCKPSV